MPASRRAGGIENLMFTLHIEHTIGDYDQWKRMFDSDPLNRRAAGVAAFRVLRTVADPNAVWIDLDFEARADAEAMKTALERMWAGPAAAMVHGPTARLSENVETITL
ncbi:hypothetical protein K2F54_09840 [Cryobacterium sp. 1639]|uniref:hypothetical protein n=1 Tax=Cryobacterium inferilacus TaxID=2866629 RepID=UPI001C73BB36|nr:hypothetical protein [Cryobacterium sp. 1639]MBX0300275.1 hypothetical protein [Cryobacterium sp. 1639]